MKTLSYSLMTVGMALALGGVVAVFDFDQPSEVFSSAWWMIVGGWGLAFTGMGIDIMYVFRIVKREPVYLFQRERNTRKRIEGKSLEGDDLREGPHAGFSIGPRYQKR